MDGGWAAAVSGKHAEHRCVRDVRRVAIASEARTRQGDERQVVKRATESAAARSGRETHERQRTRPRFIEDGARHEYAGGAAVAITGKLPARTR